VSRGERQVTKNQRDIEHSTLNVQRPISRPEILDAGCLSPNLIKSGPAQKRFQVSPAASIPGFFQEFQPRLILTGLVHDKAELGIPGLRFGSRNQHIINQKVVWHRVCLAKDVGNI